jgi:hypothetical protein
VTYDTEFVKQLQNDANAASKPDYGHNPMNVGDTNAKPGGSEFLTEGAYNSLNSDYSQWYIYWYWSKLISH